MKISEAADMAASIVRNAKQEVVRRAKGRADIDTTIACYRGDGPVAIIFQPPDRDNMLHSAQIAARGFGADVLAMAFETYLATGDETAMIDPRTGETWGMGAMQSYVDEHGFDGTVSEGICIHVMNRAGDLDARCLPYEVEGRTVTWLPDHPPDMELTGNVPAAFRAIMNEQKTVMQQIPPEVFALVDHDMEEASIQADLATVKAIETYVEIPTRVMLFAERGTPREQRYRTRLSRSQIFGSALWN